MKAIVINPFEKTVTETDIPQGDYKAIQKAIGDHYIEGVRFDPKHLVYIDEEGLLRDLTKQKFFIIKGYPNPLAGIGCILGVTRSGNSAPCEFTVEQVTAMVHFQED